MADVLINAEGVSKKFCRSLKRSFWYGLQDVARSLNPFHVQTDRAIQHEIALRADEFWALQDVSFQVRRGECLGLIGHNGAGKSTLLKILNGLIRPDAGRVEMRGRVGALIELSAGFNPILTGRENIYNQAALLGFSKSEIQAKFDEIVEFSGLADFLEMPLQRYSSGMKVKLGFAVASHLEPDILLVDEVLAVGDLGFRYKCLNKIGELLQSCAVVLVTHTMTQVMRVASHVVLLKSGKVGCATSDVGVGLDAYFQQFRAGGLQVSGTGQVAVESLQVASGVDHCGLEGSVQLVHDGPLSLEISLRVDPDIESPVVQVLLWNHDMLPVMDIIGSESHGFILREDERYAQIKLHVDRLPLNSGRFYGSIIVTSPELDRVYCQADHAFQLSVTGGSPASGAGCVTIGDWSATSRRLSHHTQALLQESSTKAARLSQHDAAIFDELRPGDIALDCGANVGLVTELMASRGARVHAFEPDPIAFDALQKRMGNAAMVTCHNVAVSDEDGLMKLYFRKERGLDPVAYSVGSTLVAEKSDVSCTEFAEVRVIRLASFLRQFPRVRMLKIDIEGAECDVLEDLIEERLLEHVDLVLVETHEEWLPEAIPRLERIRRILNERGYNHVSLNWI